MVLKIKTFVITINLKKNGKFAFQKNNIYRNE